MKPFAQRYNGVLQDLSFLVSCPILKLVVHKQQLLSIEYLPPHHQKEKLRLILMYSYCVALFAASGPM